MPTPPVERPGGGPYDPRMELRVSGLEEGMHEMQAMLGRVESLLAETNRAAIDTRTDLADLRGQVALVGLAIAATKLFGHF